MKKNNSTRWEQAEEIKANKKEDVCRPKDFAKRYANHKMMISKSDENKKPWIIEFKTPSDTSEHCNSPSIRSSQAESLMHLEAKNRIKTPKEVSAVLSFSHKTLAGKDSNGKIKSNQDAFITYSNFAGSKDKYVFGVCDGHGRDGHIISDFVKINLPKNIEIAYEAARLLDNEYITELIQQGFSKTNRQLLNLDVDSKFSGTTVVAVTILGTHLWCANVGDSRAILGKCRNNYWSVFPLSDDHTPEKPKEKERIIKYGGRVQQSINSMGKPVGPCRLGLKNSNSSGLGMSRSFGDTSLESAGKIAEAEIIDMELTEEDRFIVIASDGVWDFLTNENVLDIVKPFYQSNELDKACACLVQKAVEKWQKFQCRIDDITCVIMSLNPSIKSGRV